MQGALGLLDLLMAVWGALVLLVLEAVQGALELLELEEKLTWMALRPGLLSTLPLHFRASLERVRKRKRRLRRWDRKDPPGRS